MTAVRIADLKSMPGIQNPNDVVFLYSLLPNGVWREKLGPPIVLAVGEKPFNKCGHRSGATAETVYGVQLA